MKVVGLLFGLVAVLLGGPWEKGFGWRGSALPVLQHRFGWRAASLGLGLAWGVWHLLLLFIDGTSQAYIPPASFFLNVAAMSEVFAWVVAMLVLLALLASGLTAGGSAVASLPGFVAAKP